jgi:hypothetical protein
MPDEIQTEEETRSRRPRKVVARKEERRSIIARFMPGKDLEEDRDELLEATRRHERRRGSRGDSRAPRRRG